MRKELSCRLQVHRDKLVKEIDTLGLWTHLYTNEAITRQHVDMCRSMPTHSEQLEVLLDILEGRDDDCFEKFCQAVRQNNPELVSLYLERNVQEEDNIDINSQVGSDAYIKEQNLRMLNMQKENDKLQRKLDRLKKMKMWIEKDSEYSLIQIETEEQKERKVKETIEDYQRKYKIRTYELSNRREHRKRLESKISCLKGEKQTLEASLTQMYADIERMENELSESNKQNIDLKAQLVSVKKTNADSVVILERSTSSTSSLLPPLDLERLEVNRLFVMETIGDMNIHDLIPMLHSLNCITKMQRKSISEDMEALFKVIWSFSFQNYDSFIYCLRKLNQHHIANVLDYGGVAIKILLEVKLDKNTKRKNPLDRLNSPSNTVAIERATATWGNDRVRFLRARMSHPNEDRFIEMWFHCKTEAALRVVRDTLVMKTENSAILKKFISLFECLGIVDTNPFSKCGKPISIKAADNKYLNGAFCPHFPYGHIVQKLHRIDPSLENNLKQASVTGLACLDDRVYIISSGSSTIHVFQMSQSIPVALEPLPDINVPTIQNPVDMSGHGNFLYIVEREKECVWRLAISDGTAKMCITEIIAQTLSITIDGHLLMTRRGSPSTLSIYQRDGIEVRTIELPGRLQSIWHGLMRCNGHFVITYQESNISQLLELTNSGNETRRYTVSSKLSQNLCYMAIDDEDQIFIADPANQRILLLDSELQMARTLIWMNVGNERPIRLCLNQETGHLVVGMDNGVVEIYSVNEMKYKGMSDDEEEDSATVQKVSYC